MGASFNTMSLPASLSQDEVKKKFAEVQNEDRYENGHSYSGGFGMATGLTFVNKTFPDTKTAEEWLKENCQKWENALAVKHGGTLSGETMYLIGAWCAS